MGGGFGVEYAIREDQKSSRMEDEYAITRSFQESII